MRPGFLLIPVLSLCWMSLSAAVPAGQRPAVEAMVKFCQRFGQPGEAQSVRQDFEAGRLRIAPVPDDDNADTDTDRGLITLNPRLVQEITRADGQQSFKAIADWVATIRHERVHARQSTRSVIASNVQRTLGLGCPHEVEGWRAGFQSYCDWMERLRLQMTSAGSEAERETAAGELRELARGFQEYRQNYPATIFGDMRVTDREGVPVSLDSAAREVTALRKAADAVLEHADFVVLTNPRVQFPKVGESFSVEAMPRGGAFDEKGQGDKDQLYTYSWYADGVKLSVLGRRLSRVSTQSETITVEATDRNGRKRSGSCRVTVQEEVKPPEPKVPPRKPVKPISGQEATSGRKLHPPPDFLFENNPPPKPAPKKR